jgi:hypothetical protein
MINPPALATSDIPDVYLYGCKACRSSFRSTNPPSLDSRCAVCGGLLMAWLVATTTDLYLPDWMLVAGQHTDPSETGQQHDSS